MHRKNNQKKKTYKFSSDFLLCFFEKNEFGVKPPTEQIKHEERLRGIKYKWSS